MPTNRDNGYTDEETRRFGTLMENFNYDCTGNEAVIKDCSANTVRCPSNNDQVGRTELTCKGKTLLFYSWFEIQKTKNKSTILFYQSTQTV